MSEANAFPSAQPLSASEPTLEERERSVLAEIGREVDASVSFQGLRRQLGVHQQALARTLRRLQGQGWIAHEGRGYQLTAAGFAALHGESGPMPPKHVLPLVQAMLPPHVSAGDVSRHLSRRWFGDLRWYGQSEAPGETSLHWMADRTRVTVRVSMDSIIIEVEDEPGSPSKPFFAARPVLAAIAELYGTGTGNVESSSRSAA